MWVQHIDTDYLSVCIYIYRERERVKHKMSMFSDCVVLKYINIQLYVFVYSLYIIHRKDGGKHQILLTQVEINKHQHRNQYGHI